ncbi:hypothetical protein HYH03_007363 [Edaphochlamys debaryana]|uniref:Cleavage and polyadenylation specificity factor subunit 2 n=1 Tax=Edaphochlamys debaryana TaxID=47281 RepID=A0A835Y288_9CHLO|nr:hypothetical protein HYH03_007363 [Edaphochlamys debaryana]|eukprot:KAG2494598.1 hypothetical protein HYH03_007363 [Edaphochlamys debaryana]
METSVRFTPLCGVDGDAPLCYLLEIDSFTILLDCGWDEACSEELLEPVKKVLPRVDAVLLSHPDLAHLGALPYLVGRAGLQAPVYSTKPVRRMGEMFHFEAVLAKQAISEFDVYDLDHVDAAFRLNPRWRELRYSQRHVLVAPAAPPLGLPSAAQAPTEQPPGGGITITPLPAGRFPGGAVWRISLGCGEEVVYAVDYNHRKERLLNGTTFPEILASQQPALLVSDCLNALAPTADKRRRDEELLDAITATVEGEGCVLLPTDAAGRVLELALLLDEHFARARISATPVLLSATVRTVLEFARSQLEYFGSEMAQTFALKRTLPFSFRKLSVVTRVEELGAIPGPKVVLATLASLEAGPARQLLVEWAAQPRNTIIFTERACPGTLAHTLQMHDPSAAPEPLRLPLRMARRVPLEGEELAAWQAAKAAEAAEGALEGARRGGSGPLDRLSGAPSLSTAARLAGLAQFAFEPTSAPATPAAAAKAGGAGGGGGGGGSAAGGAATPAAGLTSRPSHGSSSTPLDQPLRSNTQSISRLVRDAATGAVVQQLAPQAAGANGFGGPGGPGSGDGGGDPGLLIDGFQPPARAKHAMFPDDDEEVYTPWDEYGAVLGGDEFRVPTLLEPGAAGPRLGAAGGGGEGMEVDGGAGAGGADVADEVEEAPTKLVETEVTLELKAALRFFDFEGRADGRSLRDTLARVAPRRLALVHGGAAPRAELAGALRHDLAEFGTEVATPGLGEVVEARLAPSHVAALSEGLAGSLDVRQAGQYGVAWLEGLFARGAHTDPANGAPILTIEPLPMDEDTPHAAAGADAAAASTAAGTGSVLLAQAGAAVTLSKLKAALAAAGFESHFPSRGVLAVMTGEGPDAGALIVTLGSQPGAGLGAAAGGEAAAAAAADRARVVLEGPTGEAYYRVREVIYSQFGVC